MSIIEPFPRLFDSQSRPDPAASGVAADRGRQHGAPGRKAPGAELAAYDDRA